MLAALWIGFLNSYLYLNHLYDFTALNISAIALEQHEQSLLSEM